MTCARDDTIIVIPSAAWKFLFLRAAAEDKTTENRVDVILLQRRWCIHSLSIPAHGIEFALC